MRIPLDRQSDIPLYQQIETFLRQAIINGSLEPETRLPSTRELAAELEVSRITVKNAYAELESDGLIITRAGSGTFVSPPTGTVAAAQTGSGGIYPLWQNETEVSSVFSSDVYKPLPNIRRHPQPIVFTGVGDSRMFPNRDFYQAVQRVLRRDGPTALSYEEFNAGYPPLRETITRVLASQGIHADPNNVLITSGSQQALSLVCQILLKPGDPILVESPTYNLALELFRSLQLKIIGVPVDEHGMQVERIEPLLQRHHPKIIYTIPNFQNPSGACMSAGRRRQLLALADCYNIPLLEDDFAGDLRYDGRAQPAIKALDPGGRVIYVATFSKMIMPGLRVGFLVADGPIFTRLLHSKWVSDLTTSTLIQRALDEYVTVGRYQAHLRRSCRVNRIRRDAMITAIHQYLPREVRLTRPQGGLFLWLRLPEGIDALDLLPYALEEGVDYTPGSWFFANPTDGDHYLRLNFTTHAPEEIRIGIQRLAAALIRMPSVLH